MALHTESDVEPDHESGESPQQALHSRRGRLGVSVSVVALVALVISAVLGWALLRSQGEEDLLVRNGDGSIALLDPGSGEAKFEVSNATPAPDRSMLFTTRSVGESTVLESRDARSGAVTGSTTLAGDLAVRSVSPAGGAVVLMPGEPGPNLYEPEPRTSTEVTVAFVDDRPSLEFELDGNIEPEMLSLDEQTLFILQFEPAMDPTSYSVRKLDLASGGVTDTDSIQVDLNSKMAGRARAQVLHPEGKFLYTLYTLPADSPVHEGAIAEGNERFAFVHVISLEEKWSFCIFLPVPFGITDEADVAMAVSPDGSRLMVVDPAIGQLAEIDTAEMTVTSLHDAPRLVPGEPARLAVAGDDTVFTASGSVVMELDRDTFQPMYAWSQDRPVTAVSVTDDELRIADGRSVVRIDRSSRLETGVIGQTKDGTVELLGPPQGSVTEFPLECAC